MKKNLLVLFYYSLVSLGAAQNIFTAAGDGAGNSGGDGGPAIAAQLSPKGIALDNVGNLYIVDSWNSYVRKVNASGIISTIAGTGVNGSTGDGGPATFAKLNLPLGIAVDALGNIYIADASNNRIRKINPSGIISTIAGTGAGGYTGDGGPATAATLNYPQGLAVDAMNNIYISDYFNYCVRKIDASGIITTIAGTGTFGFSGDGGPAIAANLKSPYNLAIDTSGNLYITDVLNNRIRKVNNSGIITTIAGTGTSGFSGDGGLAASAMLYNPTGVVVDPSGNVLIADEYNHRIRKINTSGIINTIVGNGNGTFSGDGGLASLAEVKYPSSVILDASGNIYICDGGNNRVREVCYTDCLAGVKELVNPDPFSVYPNPASDEVFIKTNIQEDCELVIYNIIGEKQINKTVSSGTRIDIGNLNAGTYFCILRQKEMVVRRDKLIITR